MYDESEIVTTRADEEQYIYIGGRDVHTRLVQDYSYVMVCQSTVG